MRQRSKGEREAWKVLARWVGRNTKQGHELGDRGRGPHSLMTASQIIGAFLEL